MTERYVVVKTHNFDPETECVAFDNYRKATAYLHWLWEDYCNEEYANGSNINEGETYHEEDYAKITWADGCITEFMLADITRPREEFSEINWESYAMV